MRLALFVSHYAGRAMLRRMLKSPRLRHVRVAVVATDDPAGPHCNAANQLWRYGGPPGLAGAVRREAKAAGLPVETGSIRTAAFARRLDELGADAGLCGCFGQKIPARVLRQLGGRVWNVHPTYTDRPWPSCAGAGAWEELLAADAPVFRYALHQVTGVIDGGPLVRAGVPVPIPPGADVLSLTRDTAWAAADLAEEHLAAAAGPDGPARRS